ncbi:hypothetical protein D3C76_790240 [compost metagenome]
MAGDVTGHQVRSELDACEVACEATCQRAHQKGLAQPRYTFEQHMAAGNQCREYVVNDAVLADHGFLQFATYCLGQLAGTLSLHGGMTGGIGLDRFTHKAFLKVCRWAT